MDKDVRVRELCVFFFFELSREIVPQFDCIDIRSEWYIYDCGEFFARSDTEIDGRITDIDDSITHERAILIECRTNTDTCIIYINVCNRIGIVLHEDIDSGEEKCCYREEVDSLDNTICHEREDYNYGSDIPGCRMFLVCGEVPGEHRGIEKQIKLKYTTENLDKSDNDKPCEDSENESEYCSLHSGFCLIYTRAFSSDTRVDLHLYCIVYERYN